MGFPCESIAEVMKEVTTVSLLRDMALQRTNFSSSADFVDLSLGVNVISCRKQKVDVEGKFSIASVTIVILPLFAMTIAIGLNVQSTHAITGSGDGALACWAPYPVT